jgi:hypothetical protein
MSRSRHGFLFDERIVFLRFGTRSFRESRHLSRPVGATMEVRLTRGSAALHPWLPSLAPLGRNQMSLKRVFRRNPGPRNAVATLTTFHVRVIP